MDDKILAIDLNLSRANISAKPKQHRYLCLNHLCILLSILSENSGTHLGQKYRFNLAVYLYEMITLPENSYLHGFNLGCSRWFKMVSGGFANQLVFYWKKFTE